MRNCWLGSVVAAVRVTGDALTVAAVAPVYVAAVVVVVVADAEVQAVNFFTMVASPLDLSRSEKD